jgi:hypothetical protein
MQRRFRSNSVQQKYENKCPIAEKRAWGLGEGKGHKGGAVDFKQGTSKEGRMGIRYHEQGTTFPSKGISFLVHTVILVPHSKSGVVPMSSLLGVG